MALTKPFAENGDKKAIPQTTSDGSVSFDSGFGSLYALPPEEGGLFIDRAQFNQLMYDTTSQVLENKQQIATQANTINEVNTNLTASINTKANQATTYNKTEVDTKLGLKADKSVTYTKTETYTKNEVNNLLNAKANSNAVVALSGNQTINGVKTFSAVPVCATAPTANNQLTNKAYVDSIFGMPNYSAGISISKSTNGTYTAPKKGLFCITMGAPSGKVAIFVNNSLITTLTSGGSIVIIDTQLLVDKNNVIKWENAIYLSTLIFYPLKGQ